MNKKILPNKEELVKRKARSLSQFFKTLSFIMVAVLLTCCSSKSKNVYTIGVDQSFYPTDFMGKSSYVLGFSMDLLQEIATIKHIRIQKIPMSWDNLVEGLNKKQYEAIITSMEPYIFYLETYQFSENYLATGPVLVMLNPVVNLNAKSELHIGVLSEQDEEIVLKHYPLALVKMIDSESDALEAVEFGQVDAILLSPITATAYIKDLYPHLKIVTAPLTQEGLKVVMLKESKSKFIKLFNEGLHELKENGTYEHLLKKWNL